LVGNFADITVRPSHETTVPLLCVKARL